MVATAAQIAANRANAQRSTGPRTPEGKAASSRNALSHGAYAADDTILATAPSTYLDDFRAHFQPVGVLEAHLVDHLAVLASRRERLQRAMDALLELNERHALTEHLHERYGRNNPNAFIDGQPSWQAALRRYDGNTYIDDRYPEPASDPDLDPDPILCSLAYTLSGPRAAALFRHEASVDRRFSATLKELTSLQVQRQAATAATAGATQPAAPLYDPRLQRALDHHPRQTVTPTNPRAAEAPPIPAWGTAPLIPDPISGQPAVATGAAPIPVSAGQAFPLDQSQSARPAAQGSTLPGQNEASATSAQKEANPPLATGDDRGAASPLQPERTIKPKAGATPRSARAVAAPARGDRTIEPTTAAYLPDDESAFLSVLPRHPDEPSSIPAHWPGALLPRQ